ncbi:MAG: 30S ribosome-binding factor RbfA [Bacillati bacterium ANGP1]|uniref:Ribosome-binding factor A n=1 Tax=Candidatus Segetimicrobium genomatis TaxID=2569760 RepID=A0A537J764_9BACT|nr:MAG: 30S ribosome-binding factor RbfA [Terrabacteria group bacterium ANGP1]
MSVRLARLRELFKIEVSAILQREMKDPRIGFVSVTDVELSMDLRHAKVFVSILGDAAAKAETMATLGNAQGFVRRELARRIRLRFIPAIHFKLDESIERGVRVQRLLRRVIEVDGERRSDVPGGDRRGDPQEPA